MKPFLHSPVFVLFVVVAFVVGDVFTVVVSYLAIRQAHDPQYTSVVASLLVLMLVTNWLAVTSGLEYRNTLKRRQRATPLS